VETIGYFLKRYREDMISRKRKEAEIDVKLAEFEAKLRAELGVDLGMPAASTLAAHPEAEREELQAV
jgi:hypothetical protein